MNPKSLLTLLISISSLHALAQDSLLKARDAVDIALRNNLRIQIARSEQDIARINNTWGNAGKWPLVTAGMANTEALSNLNQKLANGNEIIRNGVTNNILAANISASWRIYSGMRVLATKERFEELERIGELQLRQEVTQLSFEVLSAYYDILRLNLQVRAIEAIINLSKERERIADTRFNVGSAAKTDLLQARIDLNTQRVILENIRQQVRVVKANLNTLMKRPPEAPLAVADTVFTIAPVDFADYRKKAEKGNYQLLLAQRNRAVLLQDRRIVNAQRLPVLSLASVSSFNRNKATGGFFLTNQTLGPNIGINLAIPIFNGNTVRTQLKVADERLRQQELQTELLRADILRDLQVAYEEYRNAASNAEIERQNVELAMENNFISTERFRKLQSNSIELRQAQLSLIEAQDRYINAAFRAKIAATTLQFIAGDVQAD
jgi:outer membrane protein TolC